MNSTTVFDRAGFTLTGGGGWLLLQQPMPDLADADAAELLQRTAELSGNLRYGRSSGGQTLLLGEMRSTDGVARAGASTRDRFLQMINETSFATSQPPATDLVESALESSRFAWSRRGASWAIPAADGTRPEMLVQLVRGGTSVTAILAAGDELKEMQDNALAEFLCRSQLGLRGARCELDTHSARIVAWAATEKLEDELPSSLATVAVACRLLARETRALLCPKLARDYLVFHSQTIANHP